MKQALLKAFFKLAIIMFLIGIYGAGIYFGIQMQTENVKLCVEEFGFQEFCIK